MSSRPWQGIVGAGYTPDRFTAYVDGVTLSGWIPEFVVLHNTAVPTLKDWPKVSGQQRMKNLQSYYRDQQHWSAGPHLFIAPDLIWVFTPLTVHGVHSPSYNLRSWGVEVVGNFDIEALSTDHYGNIVTALSALHWKAGIDPTSLKLHKDDPATSHRGCPGKNLATRKQDLIAAIQSKLQAWGEYIHVQEGEHMPERDLAMIA